MTKKQNEIKNNDSNSSTELKKKFYSNPGCRKKPNYKAKKDEKGRIVVAETGTFDDIYTYIQSFADSVDINVLIAKFRAGDDTALNQRVGAYLDTTDIPNNYRDILNMKLETEQLFNSLPVDIKQKFNNNVDEFIMEVGKDGFTEKLNIAKKVEQVQKVANTIDSVQKNVSQENEAQNVEQKED